jgi:hypothetical protein
MATENVWTPEQFEHAFTTFGNLMLQVNQNYRSFGEVMDAEQARNLLVYVQRLDQSQLREIFHFFEFIDLVREDMQMLIEFELARRQGI